MKVKVISRSKVKIYILKILCSPYSLQAGGLHLTEMLKEQSPSPRVLLFQTMPEGLPEGCLKQQNQRAMLIVPIITQHM